MDMKAEGLGRVSNETGAAFSDLSQGLRDNSETASVIGRVERCASFGIRGTQADFEVICGYQGDI
jgi:hypothetical protein